jgi:hypothetical protein
VRTPQVSNDSAEYLRRKIGRLELDDITQLARLIDGHDALQHTHTHTPNAHLDRQRELQDQILALLDGDDSPDPKFLRESVAQLLQGTVKTRVNPQQKQVNFFSSPVEQKPVRPPRKLKGLDASTIKVPDFSDIFDDSDDVTLVLNRPKKELIRASSTDSPKEFMRASSSERRKPVPVSPSMKSHRCSKELIAMASPVLKGRRLSEQVISASPVMKGRWMSEEYVTASPAVKGRQLSEEVISSNSGMKGRRLSDDTVTASPVLKGRRLSEVAAYGRGHSPSPDSRGRASSLGPDLAPQTRRIAQIFENSKRRHTPSPETRTVRTTVNPEMALRMQRMADMIEGKRRGTPSPERYERTKRSQSIANPQMEMRRQRMVDLIEGTKPRQLEPQQRRGSGDISFRMQRVSEMMERKKTEGKRVKSGGRRKAAREIMRQRFEKSLQMLAAEPRVDAPSADLQHDYGLQQYRASAPHFGDRVKKLEQQLQHYVSESCMALRTFSQLTYSFLFSGDCVKYIGVKYVTSVRWFVLSRVI